MGYELSPDGLIDKGVSGFKGKNLGEEGSLGAFVKRAEGGKLKGCVLILEDLDRFSRTDPTVAIAAFLKLINEGVTIATLGESPKEYTQKTLNAQMSDLLTTVNEFFRSNRESRRKRTWMEAKWKDRRGMAAASLRFKMKLPAWIEFVPSAPYAKTGTYHVIKDRAKVVKEIFQRFNAGEERVCHHQTFQSARGRLPADVFRQEMDRQPREILPAEPCGDRRVSAQAYHWRQAGG